MKKILLLLMLVAFHCTAQRENSIWYFGYGAGLDFNSGSPVAITGGMVNTFEGCATMCDANGNLLLYTDGITIWTSAHTPMPNGTGLNGNASSTQSGLIVPQPGFPNIFFVFTTDATGGIRGVNYSVVDMTLNGGLGDVTIKNVQLQAPSTEQLASCMNTNGMDYWIITHGTPGDTYYVYPLTSAGVGTAVVSNVGAMFTGTAYGQMRYSCVNNKVATVVYNTSVDLVDFDPSTGIVSNAQNIINFLGTPYGAEFSPNGNYLYVSTWDQMTLTQFDITSGNAAAINASSIQLAISLNNLGTLQRAIDDKVYVAHLNGTTTGVINSPDLAGAASNYIDQAIPLGVPTGGYGLQNFPQCAYFIVGPPVINFTASDRYICPGTCINFTNFTTGATSYQWTFTGGSPDTSTAVNPSTICYMNPGDYSVTLIASNSVGSDTVTLNNLIHVYPQPVAPSISQSGDTLIAGSGYSSYQWYDGSNVIPGATNYFYVAMHSGNYNLVVSDDNGCEVGAGILNVIAGIEQVMSGKWQVTVFPNPASDKLSITGHWSFDIRHSSFCISIFNSLGEKIYFYEEKNAKEKFSKEISLKDFCGGIYFLKITGDECEIYSEKFMKL